MSATLSPLKITGLTWLLLTALTGASLAQTSVSTVPMGYFTVNIAAGTGTSPVLSILSFPLLGVASASGTMAGVVTGVTSNTITNSSAAWTAGQLSQAATPYLIQITSGTAAGRFFLISTSTSNTTTSVTLDSSETTDLTTLGIITGTDTYQIVPADTISSLFGTPATTGIVGATTGNWNSADQIQLFTALHGWASYYYNTTLSNWYQVGPPIASGNMVIRPDVAVIYNRIGSTALTLTLTGQVSSVARQAAINNGGNTFLANYWPLDLTLGTSNIQNIPGWVTSSSYLTADLVQMYTSVHGWAEYFNNGTNWIQVGPPINSNNVAIPAGTGILIIKQGSASGQSVLSQSLPYSL